MPRKRRSLIFRHTDLLRLLRTYQAAGVPQPTVKITREGDLIAIPSDAPKDDCAIEPTPLEQWRAKRSGQG
jgi:hypothetical protein